VCVCVCVCVWVNYVISSMQTLRTFYIFTVVRTLLVKQKIKYFTMQTNKPNEREASLLK